MLPEVLPRPSNAHAGDVTAGEGILPQGGCHAQKREPYPGHESAPLGWQIAADNAVFGQTGPKVGSFDAGYGSTQLARLVGQKKAREVWFLARMYSAQQVRRGPISSSIIC